MRLASRDFLVAARALCDQNNIVLIFDEVYSGWGKTGYLFNFMRINDLWPDILTYAKSFGGGKASISGYSYSEKIGLAYDSLSDATLHSTTYYGFGEETATAIEAINIINEENLVESSFEIGVYFNSLFGEGFYPNKMFKEMRGSGALWGLILSPTYIESAIEFIQKTFSGLTEVFSDPRFSRKVVLSAIVNHLYEEHGVLTYFGVNVENPLIISFPLIATKSEIEYAHQALLQTSEASLSAMILKFVKLKIKNL
jgi:putrescine aminotransferase